MSFVINKAKIIIIFFVILILITFHPVFSDIDKDFTPPPLIDYKIINIFPHSEHAFTQGLVFEKGVIYEGTGRYGKSELFTRVLEKVDPMKTYRLPFSLFGEGITIYKNKIIQLTWRAGAGLVYNSDDFRLLQTFSYSTEGWGITHNENNLIMSDGSDTLYFLDPESYREIRQVKVTVNSNPVTRINELEFVKGKVYANIWMTDRIAIIDPRTGRVEAWIDLKNLTAQAGGDSRYKTLNGIAYDAENDRLFVTGKLWPKIYEIQLIPAGP